MPQPLDRTIQYIQQHKKRSIRRGSTHCFAPFLRPKVVGLEQPAEDATSFVSGKFRSMLIDIFGRTFQEKAFFAFDRDAVARYKKRVRRNVAAVGARLEAILRNVTSAPPA